MKTSKLLFVLRLTLLLIMSTPVLDDDPWQGDCILKTLSWPSEAEEASCEGNPVTTWRSARLASKNPITPSISEWPVPTLLEALFKNLIPAPIGASREELFALYMENVYSEPPPADLSSSVPRKCTRKRKNVSHNFAATPAPAPKQAQASATSSTGREANPVLSALSNIQSSIDSMNSRIQALESSYASPAGTSFQSTAGPSSSSAHGWVLASWLPILPSCCCSLSQSEKPDSCR